MAFTVNFYINSSDRRYVVKNIQNIKSNVTCTLKDETSIVQPVLRVPYDETLYQANYLNIRELQRYYYINDISVANQIMTISCSESDVLMSFQNQLKARSATIERQSNVFNTYLNDSEYQTYAYQIITTKEFSNSFRKNEQFILIVNGGN